MALPKASKRPKRGAIGQASSSKRLKKIAPQKASRSEGSLPHAFDPKDPLSNTFCVPAAHFKYLNNFSNSRMVQERAFPHEDPHPAFFIIEQRKWTSLFTRPEDGNRSLVREFFANAIFGQEGHYFVKGRTVTISADLIRQYYHLPTVSSCKYREMIAPGVSIPTQLINRRLAKDEDLPDGLTCSKLTEAAKFWHYFLCHNILPTSNVSAMTALRSILMYCIMENHPINLSSMIYTHLINSIKNMATSSSTTKCTMIYPHLISALCIQQHVPYSVLDILEPPQPYQLNSPGEAIEEENRLNATPAIDMVPHISTHDSTNPSTATEPVPSRETFQQRILRELAELRSELRAQTELQAEFQEHTRRELTEVKELVRALLAHQAPPSSA